MSGGPGSGLLRGGSFSSLGEGFARCDMNATQTRDLATGAIGFRCCL